MAAAAAEAAGAQTGVVAGARTAAGEGGLEAEEGAGLMHCTWRVGASPGSRAAGRGCRPRAGPWAGLAGVGRTAGEEAAGSCAVAVERTGVVVGASGVVAWLLWLRCRSPLRLPRPLACGCRPGSGR